MTIRWVLHNFVREGSEDRRIRDHAFELTVSRKPGMHQVIEDPGELVLTREDEDFLSGLGISIRSTPAKQINDSAIAREERQPSSLRA